MEIFLPQPLTVPLILPNFLHIQVRQDNHTFIGIPWILLTPWYSISKKESKIHPIVGLACQRKYSNTLVWVSKYSIEWE